MVSYGITAPRTADQFPDTPSVNGRRVPPAASGRLDNVSITRGGEYLRAMEEINDEPPR
jgi:hypothetical protein